MADNVVGMGLDSVVQFGANRTGKTVIVEGREIPRLHLIDRGDMIEFIIDGRFGYDVPRDQSRIFATAVATALAVGEGHASINSDAPSRCFAPQVRTIAKLP